MPGSVLITSMQYYSFTVNIIPIHLKDEETKTWMK